MFCVYTHIWASRYRHATYRITRSYFITPGSLLSHLYLHFGCLIGRHYGNFAIETFAYPKFILPRRCLSFLSSPLQCFCSYTVLR
ncbi:hypothetical protein K435DRAFT_346888 [Dendrothele bispora CBS 962.96]|uniref:Uncharacterized protein n=1 Tax=Dendrothele bispora (strain CBS 962.96) TaxID=1314807 RepID=A0A4S8LED3_DENBC|nr:hypothetical protein K435DRAFT_346888 [Dendrothele bispora CBS 962.96]